jgi:hypothetical protein
VKARLEKTLPVLHDELFYKDSSFAVGDSFTWVDLTIIPISVKGLLLGVSLDRFPKFSEHILFCLNKPNLASACPVDLRDNIKRLVGL